MTYMHTNTPHIFIFTDMTYMQHTDLVHKELTNSRRKHGYIAILPTGLTIDTSHASLGTTYSHSTPVDTTTHLYITRNDI